MRRIALALTLLFFVRGIHASSAGDAGMVADSRIAHVTQNMPAGLWGWTFGPQSLAEHMKRSHATAVSIAVIDNYKIAWARGFGVTGPRSRAKVTDRTLFQAGSISKVVTALGILRLIDQHRLALDDAANAHLTSWKIPDNDFTRQAPVTIARLLSHTAGTRVHGFPGYERTASQPTLTQIHDGTKPANTPAIRVVAEPGSRWQYSGGGYLILQQIVVDTTHETFPNFEKDMVLRPAGMTDSTFEQPLPSGLHARAACGVLQTGSAGRGCWHVYPEMAAAGLWTTPTDLARLAIAMMHARLGQSNPLLSADLARQMFTSRGYASETFMNEGLGIFIDGPRFMHAGDDAGFVAVLVAYSSGQGAVIMCNAEGTLGLLDDIGRAIAREYHWPDSDPLVPGYKGTLLRTLNAAGLY